MSKQIGQQSKALSSQFRDRNFLKACALTLFTNSPIYEDIPVIS